MELTTILLLIFSILTLLALAAVLVLLAVPRRPKGLTDLERELRRDLQSFGDMITDNQHDANMLQEQRFANFERASGTRLETLSDKVQRMSDGVSETQQRAAQAQEHRQVRRARTTATTSSFPLTATIRASSAFWAARPFATS